MQLRLLSLYNVASLHSYDTLHMLLNFYYYLKKNNVEYRSRLMKSPEIYVNLNCVGIFEVLSGLCHELFHQAPSWWPDYEESRLLFVPTPIEFVNHLTLAILKNLCSLSYSIAASEHCGYALISFFMSAFSVLQFILRRSSKALLLMLSCVCGFPCRSACMSYFPILDCFPFFKALNSTIKKRT